MRKSLITSVLAAIAAACVAVGAPASAVFDGKLTNFDTLQCQNNEMSATFEYKGLAPATVGGKAATFGLGIVTVKNIGKRECALDNQVTLYGQRTAGDWVNTDHIFDHTPTAMVTGDLPRITWRDYSQNYVMVPAGSAARMQFSWQIGTGTTSLPKTTLYADFFVTIVRTDSFSVNGAEGINSGTFSWRSYWCTKPECFDPVAPPSPPPTTSKPSIDPLKIPRSIGRNVLN